MKIRINYVSNSSSSSFVIAYDPIFFGNFQIFLEEYQPGCESAIYDMNILKEDHPELIEQIEKERNEGNQIAYFQLDDEYRLIMVLMEMINQSNGGNKMKILYGSLED